MLPLVCLAPKTWVICRLQLDVHRTESCWALWSLKIHITPGLWGSLWLIMCLGENTCFAVLLNDFVVWLCCHSVGWGTACAVCQSKGLSLAKFLLWTLFWSNKYLTYCWLDPKVKCMKREEWDQPVSFFKATLKLCIGQDEAPQSLR